MPRRKFRHTHRYDSPAEFSHNEYLINQSAQLTTRSELLRLIRGGEDTYLELKVKLNNSEKIAQGIVALANTSGGTIIFGVNDQLRIEGVNNPEWIQDELRRICRDEIVPPLVPLIDNIAFDSGKRIVALDVDGRKKPYRTRDGRFYMRFGAEKREVSREQLSMWLDELRPLGYENIPLFNADESDFDDGMLWTFARAFGETSPTPNMYQTAEFLKKDLLLATGGADEFYPTVAALVLFGKNERDPEMFPRSVVTVTKFSGDNGSAQLVERATIAGNLLHQSEAIMRFIERFCDLDNAIGKRTAKRPASFVGNSTAPHLANLPIRPRAVFHLYSVREAVANMLVHRDLALRDVPSRINIYDASIEFINARRTNGFVPPAARAIRYGITQRINPQIAAIYNRREYGANIPRGGLPMVLRDSEKFSGRRSEIYTSNDEFKMKLYGV